MAGASWRRRCRARAAVTLLVAGIAVAGCGSSSTVTKTVTSTTSASASSGSSSSSTTAASAPAAGAGRLNGKDGGFSTAIPRHWSNGAALVSPSSINLQYVVTGPSSGGFLTNINVVREPTSSSDLDAITRASIKGVRALFSTITRMSALHPLTVGGSPARAYNYFAHSSSHRHIHVQQIVVLHGGYAYTITDTALASQYTGSVSALEQVVRGWRWH